MPFANTSRKRGFALSKETDQYSTDSLEKQISNASTRIKDSGFTPQDSDSRNWFEKATNLPQGQNWFFDTLELLGRPGSAIKNAVDKTIIKDNEDLGTSLWRGFSGKEKVHGADLAKDFGVDNKIGKFALGLGVDIALDPLTYVPGGVLLKGAKGVGSLAAAPVKYGYRALENSSKPIKAFRELRVDPALASAKDALGYMFKPDYRITDTLGGGTSTALRDAAQEIENSRQFMQEENLLGLGRIAHDAGGLENGSIIGRHVEAPLRQYEDIKGYEFPDGMTRTTDKKDLLNVINANRNQVEELGKNLRDYRIDPPASVSIGDKAYKLREKIIPATKRTPEKTVYVKPKSATASEIEEIKQINGVDHYRLKGDSEFLPSNKLMPVGVSTLTKQGELSKSISSISDELGKTEKRIRNLYFSKENAALRQLTKRKNKPLKIDELAQSKAFSKVSVSPSFNYLLQHRDELKNSLSALRNESVQAKAGSIDQINKITDDTAGLKESLRNPVMIQKELQRPARELSKDPKLIKAAKQIVAKKKAIVDFARQNGIEIPELEGHMYHILSEEERLFKKAQEAKGNFTGTNQPNKSIFNHREHMGSAEDINDKAIAKTATADKPGRRKFEDNVFKAEAVGDRRLYDYIHAVALRKKVLGDTDFAVPFKQGMAVGKNEVVIDVNNYKFLKEAGDELDGIVGTESIGGQYKVTKAAKQVLDRYQQINTDEGTKGFLKVYDTLQSLWKRGALFSLGYHARNHAGAMFNNYVGGMNPVDLLKYTKEGFEEVTQAVRGKESDLFTAYRKQGLSSSALSKVEFAKFGEEPEKSIERTIKNLSKDTKGQVTQRLNPLNAFQTSQEVGNYFDQANRFALFKWFVEKNTGKIADEKELYKKAAEKVREVQFDYSKTTPFEKNVVARVIPFYRWMRNNIPFQIKQAINDPRKYEYLNKARLNAQEVVGLNDENIPDYMKENFAIPITGDNGKGKMLGLNLPLGDLAKLSRPGKTLVDSTSTLLKTPAELALNYNTFLRKPIEKFTGQEKQYQIPFTDKGFGIDAKTAYALEQATGQIGRGLSGFLQKPESVDQDTLNRLPSLGISSLTKDYDAQKYAYYKKLDELKKLQDLMLYIEQQKGAKPRTLSEINKAR